MATLHWMDTIFYWHITKSNDWYCCWREETVERIHFPHYYPFYMLTFYVSHVVPVKEVQGKYSYVGVSEWRCRKLKRERGRTCRRWKKREKIRAKMKRGNLERLVFMQGDVVVTHGSHAKPERRRSTMGRTENSSNHDGNKTPTKLVGGYRRRWWSEKMVAEVEELRTWLKGCTMLLTMPWINLILLSFSSFPSPLIQSTLPSSDHALFSSSFCPGR